MKKENKGEIVIYKSAKNEVEVRVRFEKDTVWLRQEEIARLFSKDRSVITRHINNIFKDKEVDQKSNVQKIHIAGSDKSVAFYSLDVFLSVGYRTVELDKETTCSILEQVAADRKIRNKTITNLLN